MNNFFYLIIIALIFSACTLKKVEKHHGVRSLETIQVKLIEKTTNKNDILEILGSPSIKNSFDNDVWIYIERKYTTQSIFKLGKEKLIKNNALILEINTMGMLVKKNLININQMNNLKYYNNETQSNISKNSFVYSFLSSMRQKINDPLGKRRK
jgi:outer membrane protein assembly factor BamE (lipoprotein component of BamABCDE complex)